MLKSLLKIVWEHIFQDVVTSESNEPELEVEDVNLSHPQKPDNINSQGERSRDIHNKAM